MSQRGRASIDAPNAARHNLARLSSLSEFLSKLAQAASSHASVEERDRSVRKVRRSAGRRRPDIFERDAFVGDELSGGAPFRDMSSKDMDNTTLIRSL